MKEKILFMPLLLLSLFGCEKVKESIPDSPDDGIRFTVIGINDMKTRAGYDSPADITADDPGFGVYIVKTPETLMASGNWTDNHQIKWTGTTWSDYTEFQTGEKMEWTETAIDAYAYCPYIPKIEDPNNIALQVQGDQSTLAGLKASDLIRAEYKGKVNDTDNTIPLTFVHQLTKLKFNIISDDPIQTGVVSSATVHNVIYRYKYNLQTGIASREPYSNNLKAYCYQSSPNITTVEVIVAPTKIYKGLLLTVKVELNNTPELYVFSNPNDIELKPNTIYNFNIELVNNQKDLVSVSEVKIGNWTEVDKGISVLDPINK